MSRIEKKLLCKAYRRHPNMRPVGGRALFADCVTETIIGIILWYDTPDHSTHVVMHRMAGLQHAAA